MFGGLNRLLLAALVAGCVLVATPSAALACNGSISAVNVYRECLPTGGGGKSTSGGGGGGGKSSSGGSSTVPLSARAARVISHAPAKDRRFLSTLVKSYSPAKLQIQPDQVQTPAPSAIGSAFDLGSGPTALLVALAATAFLLLAGTVVHGARQRRR